MIYPYRCPKGHDFEVIKGLANIDREETCECGEVARRMIGLTRLDNSALGDWNTPHLSPALGQVVKSNKHARQIAKEKGLIEVGNEPVENIHKHFDRQREDTRKQRWQDADRVMKYD